MRKPNVCEFADPYPANGFAVAGEGLAAVAGTGFTTSVMDVHDSVGALAKSLDKSVK